MYKKGNQSYTEENTVIMYFEQIIAFCNGGNIVVGYLLMVFTCLKIYNKLLMLKTSVVPLVWRNDQSPVI